ncbi:iron-containing redox enzyme family protein [Halomicronema sp. CCY15110]|uniref:iron-containing redox enzyme family protein n=1 Tax=Halomicronema sp. CCY15110 TaxID=2767773 RepID=UPI00194F10E6|nr:iron-containing redox enzyme family protein [Halomicronema sp. CCY15110]
MITLSIRPLIETHYVNQVQVFADSPWFQHLEQGQASRQEYDAFIFNLCQTHLKSPQILAFLYAVAPPTAAPQIKHNLLEELGLDQVAICHPDLLYQLATAAGFDGDRQTHLAEAAQAQIRQLCTDPLLFGTIQELGLSVLLEVTCFEWMLSRLASRIGKALAAHRGLPSESLTWFHHHSEVDIRHAEEGLDSVEQYLAYYEIEAEDLETILDITFRENIFVKRYFADLPAIAGAADENR